MALSADANIRLRSGELLSLPVMESVTIYAGALVALNSTGYAVPAASTAGYRFVGRAEVKKDNLTGASAALYVPVRRGVFLWPIASATDPTDLLADVWATADSIVSKTQGACYVGKIVAVEDSTHVWVDSGQALDTPLVSQAMKTAIVDVNGNELVKLTATAAASNEITLANAATAGNPTITASGGDANVGVTVQGKGTGKILLQGYDVDGSAYVTGVAVGGHATDVQIAFFSTSNLASQQAFVSAAATAYTQTTTTELVALATKINSALTIIKTYGLMASA